MSWQDDPIVSVGWQNDPVVDANALGTQMRDQQRQLDADSLAATKRIQGQQQAASYAAMNPLQKAGAQAIAGIAGGMGDIGSLTLRGMEFLGVPGSQGAADAWNRDLAKMQAPGGQEGIVGRGIRGATRSVGKGAAIGRVLGTPGVIGEAALSASNQAYTQGIDAGMTPAQARTFAATKGGIEGGVTAIFNKFAPGLEKILGGGIKPSSLKDALVQTARGTLQEYPEELIIATADAVVDRVSGIDPNALTPQKLAGTFADVLTQTTMAGGVSAPAAIANIQGPPEATPEVAASALAYSRNIGNEESLRALAEKESPSRTDWEKAGLKSTSAAYRKQFAESLRGVLEQESAQPEIVPPAAEATAEQPAPAQPQAPVVQVPQDVPGVQAELDALNQWLDDADVSDPEYDTKSIRAQLLTAQLAKQPRTVRMYHGGGNPEKGIPLWFSSDEKYATGYAAKSGSPVWYVDVPRDHPVFNAEYPEQTVDQGFTVNAELPAELSDQRKRLDAKSLPRIDTPGQPTPVSEPITIQEPPNGQEEGQAEAPRVLDSPVKLSPAKPKLGRKIIPRAKVVAAFPGAKIEEIPGGWRAYVGQSYVDVVQVNEVAVDWDAMEKQQGRKYSVEDRQKAGAAGKFGFRTQDGKVHDGLGLIQISESLADDTTVQHEALHLARRAGLLTEPEYQALVEKYYNPSATLTPEEQVAVARQSWKDNATLWEKIQGWVRGVLASIGLSKHDAENVFRMMDSAGFWQREGKLAPEGEAMQVARERGEAYQAADPTAEQLQSALAQGPVQIKTDKWTYRATGLTADGTKVRTSTGQLLPLAPIAEGRWQIVAGKAQTPTTASQAMAETEASPAYAVKGRPDLANPGDTQAVRNLVDTVDEQRNEAGEPQRRSDADVQAEADARLEADYEGERAKLIATAKAGGQLGDTDTLIAQRIVRRDGVEATTTGNQQMLVDTMALADSYRRTGTEQARAFRQRHDPLETPAERMQRGIIEATLEPPADLRNRIDEAERSGDHAEADRVRKEWAKKFEELKKQLKELGVDLDDLNKLGYDPIKQAKALGAISAAKATWNDVLYEYWRNAILSSVKTQAANMLGNTIHPLWHYLVERPVEAAINLVVRDPEGATFGEFAHMFDACQGAMKRAARNFWMSYHTELPQFDREVGREGQFKHESPNVAIKGRTGKIVRMPQRFMLAADEFAKSLICTMEAGARAYRTAQSEGLESASLQDRTKALTDDIESKAWNSAYDHTLTMTFQQRGGKIAQQAKQAGLALRRTSIGKWFLPFVTTPVNILETGINKSPLGLFTNLAPKMVKNMRAGKPAMKGLTPDAAQQVIAWAAMLGLWAMIPDDEEDRLITGTNKYTKRDARREKIGPPPLSVRIGGRWYSYARIEPFATSLGLAVDFIDGLTSGDLTAAATSPIASLAKQAKDKTFLEGIGSLVEVLESGLDPEEILQKGSGFAVSWIPNLIRTGGRSLDSELPQMGVWGEGAERAQRIGARTLQRTELLPASVTGETKRYDIWGRTLDTSAGGPVYRGVVPVDNRSDSDFIGDRMILNYNAKNPSDERKFMQPGRSIRIDGKDKSLTDQQYEDYARISGAVARKLVESAGFNSKPSSEDMDRLNDLVLESRDIARDVLKPHWEGKPLDDSEHGIAVLAASGFLRDLGQARPQTLPKAQKDKGVTWKAFQADYNAKVAAGKKYLADNQITRGEAVAAFDKLVAHLEPENRKKQKGVLLSRLSKP